MRDRREPEQIAESLRSAAGDPVASAGIRPPVKPSRSGLPALGSTRANSTAPVSDVSGDAGLDSPAARFFSWLGNHFFAVTLVLTGAMLAWALTR